MRTTLTCGLVRPLLMAGIIVAAAQSMAQQKAPVPDAKAQQAARKAARDVYGARFGQASTAADKLALAKEMLDAASKVGDGSADQYALLKIAAEIAADAGDVPTAIAAAEELSQRFDVPGAKLKAEALLAISHEARTSAQHKAVAEAAVKVLDELAAADEYETAQGLCKSAWSAARQARQYTLVKELTARAHELDEQAAASRGYRDALAALDREPGNPAANLAAGRYLCLVKGDWARGVPMLALGSDAELKDLAVKDLKEAKSAEEQAALGDGWWNLAQTKEGPERDALKLRAGSWYEQARTGLAGLARVKVDERLKEIARLGREIPETAAGPPRAIAPFDAKKAKGFQVGWAKHLHVPVVQTNSIGMKLVLIPPGEFEMGSTKKQIAHLLEDRSRQNDPEWYYERVPAETPRHRVKITKPFYLAVCEVTQAQYQRVMGNNPCTFQGDKERPVEQVSWNEAVEFCRRLTELREEKAAGAAYRLPTEAEWEYGCRAGTTTYFYFGDDASQLARYAWLAGNSQRPHATRRPIAAQRLGSLRHVRERVGVVCGLARRGLLREIVNSRPARPGFR